MCGHFFYFTARGGEEHAWVSDLPTVVTELILYFLCTNRIGYVITEYNKSEGGREGDCKVTFMFYIF